MNIFTGLLGLSLLLPSVVAHASGVDWLVGCWETPDGSSKEVWVKEPDGSLMGFGGSIADNQLVFYEVLRVAKNQDDILSYTAYPAGQSPTTFLATDTTSTSVVFSNPEHDYPQEIAYRLEETGLYATISALNGKNPQSFNKRRCVDD